MLVSRLRRALYENLVGKMGLSQHEKACPDAVHPEVSVGIENIPRLGIIRILPKTRSCPANITHALESKIFVKRTIDTRFYGRHVLAPAARKRESLVFDQRARHVVCHSLVGVGAAFPGIKEMLPQCFLSLRLRRLYAKKVDDHP